MLNKNIKLPVNIPVSKIHPFEGNPYKVLDNEEMNFLIESIQQQGIISPVVVRPLENTKDEYEVISGHRRMRASVKAGLETVPAFIYAVTRDEAAIMLVDSNLHREHILPSEKAFAYKLKSEALKHQGKRSDLTSVQVAPKLATEQIGETENISKDTVKRYIRLTYLIPELLDLVDEKRIAFTPAVELSYLNEVEQADLVEEISACDATPNLSQAQRLRAISREEGLTPEHIGEILAEEKANQRPTVKFSVERLQKVAPKVKESDLENFVMKACEHYYRYLQRQRNRDAR
ncbi:MAG: ParB/RepB/Spo0J family partition protein [Clostridia bacterium]|nr:ParB/RepB/Spo0J family partition protein [Clostridia bacterium]